MDKNEAELLQLIYTRVGMIMEDASIVALELGGPGNQSDAAKIEALRKSVDTISALADAAEALSE